MFITVQTPIDSLVLTSGCFHQILNLTAVEGWSSNFLPPAMIDLVESVRQERALGWRWNYQESVSLMALCWKAIIKEEEEEEGQDDEEYVNSFESNDHILRAQLNDRHVNVRIKLKIDGGEEVKIDHAQTSSSSSSVSSPPNSMQLACARVLQSSIEREFKERDILLRDSSFDRSSFEMTSKVGTTSASSSTRKRQASKRRRGDERDTDEDESDADSEHPILDSLRLPLSSHPSPSPYPELCTFCQNLSFFSSIYVDLDENGDDTSVGRLRRGTSSLRTSANRSSKMNGFHLCCTSCLARFVSIARQQACDNGGDANKSRKTNHRSKKKRKSYGDTRKQRMTSSTVAIDRLPSDDEKEQEFYQIFSKSVKRHARWWRRAFIGVRVKQAQLKRAISVTRDILAGQA